MTKENIKKKKINKKPAITTYLMPFANFQNPKLPKYGIQTRPCPRKTNIKVPSTLQVMIKGSMVLFGFIIYLVQYIVYEYMVYWVQYTIAPWQLVH
jgi:hypothetical protein